MCFFCVDSAKRFCKSHLDSAKRFCEIALDSAKISEIRRNFARFCESIRINIFLRFLCYNRNFYFFKIHKIHGVTQ
ncbi:hypothetical protein ACWIUD_09540 [Helicobacter sp. 23-1044]